MTVSAFSDRERHSFFGHVAVLSIEEENELHEYLNALSEFKEWDETGFRLGLRQKLLKASARSGATADSIKQSCDEILVDFHKYKELGENLRCRVKNWCRAMAEESG